MKLITAMVALLAASATNMMASGIVLCYDTVGAGAEVQRATPCASQANFSVVAPTSFVDWGLPSNQVAGQPYGMGSADSTLNANRTFTPGAAGGGTFTTWNARSDGDLVTVGATRTPDDFTGTSSKLIRIDNGSPFVPGTVSTFSGHFSTAGTPYGDHLIGFESAQGPLLLNFSTGVHSVGFYISTKALTGLGSTQDFSAIVKAYDHTNPLSTDTPVLTYRINSNGTGGGGTCNSLADDGTPCNDAPFLGIDGNSLLLGSPMTFSSIVISTTDSAGFYIDSLALGTTAPEIGPGDPNAPEPASAFLIGGGMLLVALASRKFKARV